MWHYEKSDFSSAKLTYHIGMDFMGTYKSENNHPSSSNEVAKTMWRLLWQTEIPPKVKLLGWKICSSIVPTTRNLRQQQLFVEDVCPHCR